MVPHKRGQNTDWREVRNLSRTARGKRDGTGPHKNSDQRRKHGAKGRRKQAGEKCPKE